MIFRTLTSYRLLVVCLGLAAGLSKLHAADSAEKSFPEVRGHKVNGVYDGPVEIWIAPEIRQAAGECNHGQPNGQWTFWDSGGTKITEITYRDGTFFGKVTVWQGTAAGPHERGKMKMRGAFMDGMWQGSVLTFYPDGRTRSERVYAEDVLTSAYAYSPKGQALPPEQAKKVAAEDERVDNAFVDALDNFVRKWTVRPAAKFAKAD